jgi:tetratricopeptide (TPR) repeat protein
VRQAPDLPSAYSEWGAMLLAKGDADGAIAKLEQAQQKGPHFADPPELWGEALMKKGDYAGALTKFAEADGDAPRWGRNHMRWGEALMLSGRYAEARAQYETANGLDLSKPDRAALDVLLARTATGPLHG